MSCVVTCLIGSWLRLRRLEEATANYYQDSFFAVLTYHEEAMSYQDFLTAEPKHVSSVSLGVASSLDLSRLEDFPYLKELRIETRLLSDEHLSSISNLATLERLYLFSDRLTAIAIRQMLFKMYSLERIELGGVKFTNAEKQELCNAFPNLEIQYRDVDWDVLIDYQQQKQNERLSPTTLKAPSDKVPVTIKDFENLIKRQ